MRKYYIIVQIESDIGDAGRDTTLKGHHIIEGRAGLGVYGLSDYMLTTTFFGSSCKKE